MINSTQNIRLQPNRIKFSQNNLNLSPNTNLTFGKSNITGKKSFPLSHLIIQSTLLAVLVAGIRENFLGSTIVTVLTKLLYDCFEYLDSHNSQIIRKCINKINNTSLETQPNIPFNTIELVKNGIGRLKK